MKHPSELNPEVALERLIRLEHDRERSNRDETCVICSAPANRKPYPAPFVRDDDAGYRACGRPHADRFYGLYVDLHNDVLRPWRALHNAWLRGEQTIELDSNIIPDSVLQAGRTR